jgi:hypothetical protein
VEAWKWNYRRSVSIDIKFHRFTNAGTKILECYRRQKNRKKIIGMLKVLIPIYYDPRLKGGFFAKKGIDGIEVFLKSV